MKNIRVDKFSAAVIVVCATTFLFAQSTRAFAEAKNENRQVSLEDLERILDEKHAALEAQLKRHREMGLAELKAEIWQNSQDAMGRVQGAFLRGEISKNELNKLLHQFDQERRKVSRLKEKSAIIASEEHALDTFPEFRAKLKSKFDQATAKAGDSAAKSRMPASVGLPKYVVWGWIFVIAAQIAVALFYGHFMIEFLSLIFMSYVTIHALNQNKG